MSSVRVSWRAELPILVLLVAMLVATALTWSTAPDLLPVHWGLNGRPDRFGGKFEGLLLLPLIALAIYLLTLWVPRLDPMRANYAHFAGAYAGFRLALMSLFAGIDGAILMMLRGARVNMGMVVPLLLGVVFVAIGNLLAKVQPNWFVGIRTPWTLSSRRSWDATHRAGGRIFVVMGLLLFAMAFVRAPWAIWTMIALVFAGPLFLVIYSYREWRDDPDKHAPGRPPAAS